MKNEKIFTILIIAALVCVPALSSCSDDDDGGGGDQSVKIDNAVEDMDGFPSDAEVYEAESYSINGEEITGTDSTSIGSTDDMSGETSVTIPTSLARAPEDVSVFGYWFNGSMTTTPATDSIDALMSAIETIFTSYVDDSVSDKIKIDGFPLFFESGDNYFCFYFEDSTGNTYRTPVIKIKYNIGGVDIDNPL
ncbi:MAG: hypothetical protein ACOC2H_09130 [Spirochaetota bacterium]